MEKTHEYANELGIQGGKNPRKIPKFSINHERFSRTIEKNIYNDAHALIIGNLNGRQLNRGSFHSQLGARQTHRVPSQTPPPRLAAPVLCWHSQALLQHSGCIANFYPH